MKQAKKIFFIILFFSMIIFIKNSRVEAAGASLTASTMNPTQGQTVTVTGTVTAGAWNVTLSGNGQSKTIYGYTNVNGNATGTDSITFTAGAPGTKYTFSLIGGMTDINASSEEPVNRTITIEVVASGNEGNGGTNGEGNQQKPSTPTLSSNANLSNLGINPYDFSGFKADKTEYNVTVPNDVTSVKVYAKVQASGAKYVVSGNANDLQVGTNSIRITVTAPDGKTQKTYIIRIARQADTNQTVIPNVIEEPNEKVDPSKEDEGKDDDNDKNEQEPLGLLSITMEGDHEIYLEPEFKMDLYEYTIHLKEDLETLPLKVIPNREKVEVTISGNENLEEGENIITIEVQDEETEETVIYTILVNKTILPQMEEEKEEENVILKFLKDNWVLLAIGVAVVLLVIVTIVSSVMIKRRKEDQEFFADLKEQREEEEEEDWEEIEPIEKKKTRGKHF